MSKVLLVCEGTTDRIVLEAIVATVDPLATVTQIQPPTSLAFGDAGPFGGGWKGVRAWCQRGWPILKQSGMQQTSTLVVHLDADVATDGDVNCARPCPPIQATTDALRAVITGWMGEITTPPRTVRCTPAQSTEAWVFAALSPNDPQVHPGLECRREPAALLVGRRPKLVTRKNGSYKKDTREYQAHAARIAGRWSAVTCVCTEAARFNEELVAMLRS
jgi:hypothetical protein